jgi:ribosomal protein S18 acetylase RimI-like enzyme
MLRQEMADSPIGATLLWQCLQDKSLTGCVWVEPLGEGEWYLGALTVDPRLQDKGLGRKLLEAAELWIAERGGQTIKMTVINIRDTLLAWYRRRGYRLTGEREPFPYDDHRFGTPTRDDLHFVVLRKTLAAD